MLYIHCTSSLIRTSRNSHICEVGKEQQNPPQMWRNPRKSLQKLVDECDMENLDATQVVLIAVGATVMTGLMLRAIAQSSFVLASDVIQTRRALEAKRHADNAEAEAAGRAAALEPLVLNADGTIEEPIIAVVERP